MTPLNGFFTGRASPAAATPLEDRVEELLQGGDSRRNALRQVARENMEAEVRESLADALQPGNRAQLFAQACGMCCGLFVIGLMILCVTLGTCCSVLSFLAWLSLCQLVGCEAQAELRAWLFAFQALSLLESLLANLLLGRSRAFFDRLVARFGLTRMRVVATSVILVSAVWKVSWCLCVQAVAARAPQSSCCGAWLPHFVVFYSYVLLLELLVDEPFTRLGTSLMVWTAANGFLQTVRHAKPGTLESLELVEYDPSMFADEDDPTDGRPQEECCICLETYSSSHAIVRTPCGHLMHRSCLGKWLQTSHFCPLCRADLEERRFL